MTGGRKALAEKAGVSEAQLYRYIKEESQPTVEPIARIAAAAGVTLTWLIAGVGGKQSFNDALQRAPGAPRGDRDEREKRAHMGIRESAQIIQATAGSLGFDPGSFWGTLTQELMLLHGLDPEGVRRLFESVKYLQDREQGAG